MIASIIVCNVGKHTGWIFRMLTEEHMENMNSEYCLYRSKHIFNINSALNEHGLAGVRICDRWSLIYVRIQIRKEERKVW